MLSESKVLANIGLNNPNQSTLPLIGGVAKVFVAEVVEKGMSLRRLLRFQCGDLLPQLERSSKTKARVVRSHRSTSAKRTDFSNLQMARSGLLNP
jgi:hypothetical protein